MSDLCGISVSDSPASPASTSLRIHSSSERPEDPAWDPAAPLPGGSIQSPLELSERCSMDAGPSSAVDAAYSSYASRVSDLRSRILNIGRSIATPVDLPTNQRQAIWHPQSGLFVSPNVTYVPRMEEESGSKPNWSVPRILCDDELFRAFRPRIVRNSGDLFGRLNITNSALSQAIFKGARGFVLEAGIANSWIRLENALLDLTDSLLPKSAIPIISYPRFPYEYGYRDGHDSMDMTLRCAIRSRDAFVDLSSLVSFVIALNMDDDGSYESAFYRLRSRSREPVHSAWLDQLKLSQVCDFSAGFRVGVVVNPYACNWTASLYKFALAHVPIWIFWGHQFKSATVSSKLMEYFRPPDDVVGKAIDRSKKSSDLILPSYRFDVMNPPPLQVPNVIPDCNDCPTPNSPELHSHASPPPSEAPNSPMNDSLQDTQPTWAAIDDSPPPLPESSNTEANTAKALAALDEFFAQRRKVLERRIANEHPVERQRRLAREAGAKSRATFSRKSTVFEWVDMGNGVYERTQLQFKQADFYWSNFTKNQRIFTSFNNQWDLCPQLPKYSEEFPDDNDPNDIDYDDGYSDDDSFFPMNPKKPSALAIPQDGHTNSALLDLQTTLEETHTAVDEEDDTLLTVAEGFNIESFLRDRFGYTLSLPFKWPVQALNQSEETESPVPSTSQMKTPSRHAPSKRRSNSPLHRALSTSRKDSAQSTGYIPALPNPKSKEKGQEADSTANVMLTLSKALMSLSFHSVELDASAEAGIINLVNTLANAKGTFIDLPANFDHSHAHSSPLSLTSETLELSVVSTCTPVIFLLRNLGGSFLSDPWLISTEDASTVLLVFRKKWSTVHVIARELTRRGARFNTVKAMTTEPQPAALQNAPLGIRLKGYKPTREDYDEYLRRRDDLLRGPKGRAALMQGGIIARIARDVTEPSAVLDGPIYGDRLVCKYRDLFFVDDQLTESDKYTICGVYFAQTKQSPEGERLVDGAIQQLSWWPQDALWNSMGCFLRTEWTELAEAYFEKRMNITQTELTILGASQWRATLRKANAWTKKIEAGAEHYQRDYLMHCHREMLLQTARAK